MIKLFKINYVFKKKVLKLDNKILKNNNNL